jgi:hypothetical protein
MATTTPNHGFKKPAATDNVNIAVLNSNMDKLDTLFDAKEITMLNYALAAANAAISTSDTVNTAIGKLEKRLATVEADTGNPEPLSASNIAADYTADLVAPADITENDTILQVLQKLMAYIRFWTVRRIAVIDGKGGRTLTAYGFDDVATATVKIPTKLSDLTVTEPLSASNIAADYTADLVAPADITENDTILQVLQKLMAYIRFWTVRRIAVIDGKGGRTLTAYGFDDVATATVKIPTKLSDLTVTEPLSIANGGTGAATANAAARALGTCYATCDAAARLVAKTVTLLGKNTPYNRFAGSVAYVLFVNGNTAANPTLDVAGTGAAAIINCHTNAAVSATDIGVNMTAHLVFNGSSWVLMNPAS